MVVFGKRVALKFVFNWFFISSVCGILVACETGPSIFDYYTPASRGGGYNPGGSPTGNPQTPGNPLNPNIRPGSVQRVPDLPYELIPDTITALTCRQTQYISSQIPFTLTVGAYNPNRHGLQLSQDFLRNNGITQNTPPQQIRQLLEQSPFKSAIARIALSNEGNLKRFYEQNKQTINGFFPIFDNPSTLHLLSQLQKVFATRSSSTTQANRGGQLAAWLPIKGMDLIGLAPGLSEQTPGSSLLTLTYMIRNNLPVLSMNGQPYGRGYKLQFNKPYYADYLVNIKEENLVTTQESGSWVCPSDLRFMVHRSSGPGESIFNKNYSTFRHILPPGTVYEGYCSSTIALSKRQRWFFNAIFGNHAGNFPHFGRTMIMDSRGNWQSTPQPCIKFQLDTCYLQHFYRIEFDPSKLGNCAFRRDIPEGGERQRPDPRYFRICPAFLSICYRVR